MRLLRVQQDAVVPARIVEDVRPEHAPVAGVDDHRPDGVGAVIEADGERALIHDSRQLLNATTPNPQSTPKTQLPREPVWEFWALGRGRSLGVEELWR